MMMRLQTARKLTLLCVVLLVVASMLWKLGAGNLCAFGFGSISLLCPIGALEAGIAQHHFAPRLLVSMAFAVALAVLFGRAFCSWVCPLPPFQNWLLRSRSTPEQELPVTPPTGKTPHTKAGPFPEAFFPRLLTLAAVLIPSAIFRFPVFCLVCPIGLIFASLLSFWRLLRFNEPTWAVLIFPVIILAEMTLFRRWCSRFCPVGALMSLLGSLNLFFRPKIDASACLREKGIHCQVCTHACSEGLSPREQQAPDFSMLCTKCHECAEACPTHAITFPFIPSSKTDAPSVTHVEAVVQNSVSAPGRNPQSLGSKRSNSCLKGSSDATRTEVS